MASNMQGEAVDSFAIVAKGPKAEDVGDGEAAEAEEVKIAVVGVTGSGKSTFIRTMTEDADICVGHKLQSATSEVGFFRFTYESIRFVLIDTPGFDNASCSDEEIMTQVQKRLESSFPSGHLNGLIYMHRIIDPKVRGSARSSMHMFRKLCGPDSFQNIVLATTFWDDVSIDEGVERERQLKENDDFWGALVRMGSQVVRLDKDRESGLKVLLEIAKKSKNKLRSRREIVKGYNSAPETTAIQAIDAQIQWQKQEEFKSRHEEERFELERRLERMAMESQQALEAERKKVAEEVKMRVELVVQQIAEEDAAWEAEHEREWETLQEEQERTAEEMKRRNEAVKKRREALIVRLREEEELRVEQEKYYYTCEKPRMPKIRCGMCRRVIKGGYYWYCRRCQSGNGYYECAACGNGKHRSCGVREHPQMKKRFQQGDSCTVM